MTQSEILTLDAESYKGLVKKSETGMYHCRIEQKRFSQSTGERLSIARIAKFERKAFKAYLKRNLELQGYAIDILWNPDDYDKAIAEKKAEGTKNKGGRPRKSNDAPDSEN